MADNIQVIGWTDHPQCYRCGRADLERTVAIDRDGVTEYYGSECIKKVLGARRGKEVLAYLTVVGQIERVRDVKGWEAAVKFALMRYGWGTDKTGNIVDGLGRVVLTRS